MKQDIEQDRADLRAAVLAGQNDRTTKVRSK